MTEKYPGVNEDVMMGKRGIRFSSFMGIFLGPHDPQERDKQTVEELMTVVVIFFGCGLVFLTPAFFGLLMIDRQ